jgi:hypothetical protein
MPVAVRLLAVRLLAARQLAEAVAQVVVGAGEIPEATARVRAKGVA